MALRIGIDSSKNKKLSCCMLGFDTEINKIYKKIDKLFVSCNEKGTFHWSRITRKNKSYLAPKILKHFNGSKLRFIVFEHIRPRATSKRAYFLDVVTNEIASELEKHLKGKGLKCVMECDDDFDIKGIKNGTLRFIEKLLEKISFRLSGKMTKVLDMKTGLKVDFKQHPNKAMTIYANVKSRHHSRAIQLSDIALGLFNYKNIKTTKFIKRRI